MAAEETTALQPQRRNTTLAPVSTSAGTGVVFQTMDDMIAFAGIVHKSNLAPRGLESPEKIFIAMQVGAEVGLTPMMALQSICVINNRPCLFGDAPLAIARSSPKWDEKRFREYTEGTFDKDDYTAICEVARVDSPNVIRISFSIGDAKRAGIWGKDGPWRQYPKRMLQMRARQFAIRDGFGGEMKGMPSREEVEDMPAEVREVSYETATGERKAIASSGDESRTDVLEAMLPAAPTPPPPQAKPTPTATIEPTPPAASHPAETPNEKRGRGRPPKSAAQTAPAAEPAPPPAPEPTPAPAPVANVPPAATAPTLSEEQQIEAILSTAKTFDIPLVEAVKRLDQWCQAEAERTGQSHKEVVTKTLDLTLESIGATGGYIDDVAWFITAKTSKKLQGRMRVWEGRVVSRQEIVDKIFPKTKAPVAPAPSAVGSGDSPRVKAKEIEAFCHSQEEEGADYSTLWKSIVGEEAADSDWFTSGRTSEENTRRIAILDAAHKRMLEIKAEMF